MSVQAVDARLNRGFLEKSDVGGCLTGFRGQRHHHLTRTGNHAEGIDYYLAFYTLHGIHYHGNLVMKATVLFGK
jgi:hypothetical protein